MTLGRTCVWRQPNADYAASNIQETIPFDGDSLMVLGCILHDCKLDLVTVHSNLNRPRYEKDILETIVVSYFDSHALVTRPKFMDNVRPP